ncbi:hypothetical protein IG631_03304 [Alternaria alternata]|nr:hypothetical protein IG631_03304 [Alternaria alternata]
MAGQAGWCWWWLGSAGSRPHQGTTRCDPCATSVIASRTSFVLRIGNLAGLDRWAVVLV